VLWSRIKRVCQKRAAKENLLMMAFGLPRDTVSKGQPVKGVWENRPGGPPNSSRLLELADIAVGLKKPSPKKRKHSTTGTHETAKKEPYSS
jgi:hypothetical protein